jgi:hypothetical protein
LSNFSDVRPGDYYYDSIATAKARGLILGVDSNNFAPTANITNQDLYVMTYRAVMGMRNATGHPEVNESLLGKYTDQSQIADYAKPAIAYFTTTGALTQNELKPRVITNRAEAAEFIANVVRSER